MNFLSVVSVFFLKQIKEKTNLSGEETAQLGNRHTTKVYSTAIAAGAGGNFLLCPKGSLLVRMIEELHHYA